MSAEKGPSTLMPSARARLIAGMMWRISSRPERASLASVRVQAADADERLFEAEMFLSASLVRRIARKTSSASIARLTCSNGMWRVTKGRAAARNKHHADVPACPCLAGRVGPATRDRRTAGRPRGKASAKNSPWPWKDGIVLPIASLHTGAVTSADNCPRLTRSMAVCRYANEAFPVRRLGRPVANSPAWKATRHR